MSLPAPQVSGQCANRIRPYHGLATTNNPPKHCRSSRQCERVALALLNAETEAGKQSLLEAGISGNRLRCHWIRRLLEAAGDRRIAYLIAVDTGLRRSEIKNLQWRHVYLHAEVPYIFLEGRYTKNKRDAYIPLLPELVAEFHRIKPSGANSGDPVLVGTMMPTMWKMKSDLKNARIDFERDGRRADFHSLRHTFATRMAQRNIPPRVAMQLMRHSDMRLTMSHYTDQLALPPCGRD